MIALKFLRPGRIGPFSGSAWPAPADRTPWVQAHERGRACDRRVHACRVDDLPEWLDAELWRVELAGDVRVDCGKLVADRGRLLERVEAWDAAAAADFAAACAERARAAAAAGADAGYVADAATHAASARADAAAAAGHAATAAFVAAHAAADAAGDAKAARRERAWQARWLAARLGIDC